MTKKKELIVQASLKRREDQERKRILQQEALARKRDEQRSRREEQDRKREEERQRKQKILDEYRLKKALESEETPTGGPQSLMHHHAAPLRDLNTRTVGRAARARPQSMMSTASTGSSFLADFASLEQSAARARADSTSFSRPQSALSTTVRSTPMRDHHQQHHVTPMRPCTVHMPNTSMSGLRPRGALSDGASDIGSSTVSTEYSGPKLFVKPTQKSNRSIILNAVNVVLAGAVNQQTKKKVLEELNNSDARHFLLLFRGAGLQFRALYSYDLERDEAVKLAGVGPRSIHNHMVDRYYKYNSGSKHFNTIETRHMSVAIDAITIHNSFWAQKPRPQSALLSMAANHTT